MTATKPVNLWTSTDHARDYLERADSISHRSEGESALLEFIPATTRRILDLGTGDGRLLALVRRELFVKNWLSASTLTSRRWPSIFLPRCWMRFASASRAILRLASSLTTWTNRLPALGKFDAVISSFAIHHLVHERKRALYAEIYGLLNPGGVFCNLEHVASPTPRLHEEFLERIGFTVETEDPSNKLLDVETQLGWLREIGFADVDCTGSGGSWRCWWEAALESYLSS